MQLGLPCDDRLRFADVDLAVRAADHEQLRSSREKFRRAAFIGLDVRVLVANDAVERLAKLRQRECVGRGAIKDKKHLTVGFENLAHQITDARWPTIIAGRRCRADMRRLQRGESRRTNPGGVVAGKLMAVSAWMHGASVC